MSNPNRIRNILNRLVIKTNNGSYTWEHRSQDYYNLSLNSGVLNLNKISNGLYRLSIYKRNGALIERVQSDTLDEEARDLLDQLYDTVETLFSVENSTLDELLDELNDGDGEGGAAASNSEPEPEPEPDEVEEEPEPEEEEIIKEDKELEIEELEEGEEDV